MISSPREAQEREVLPKRQRSTQLLVGLRNQLRYLYLPSSLVFRKGAPHLLIEQVPALVRVMPLGFLCHLPQSSVSADNQSMVIAQPLEEAAVQISSLVNEERVAELSRRVRDPYRQAPLPHELVDVFPRNDHDGPAATHAHSELVEAAHALRCGMLSIHDLEPAEDTPPTEFASAAYMAAGHLRDRIANNLGHVHLMPVNRWVAMALVEHGPSILTDGTFTCWINPRSSMTGRDLLSFVTTMSAAATRLLHVRTGASPAHHPRSLT